MYHLFEKVGKNALSKISILSFFRLRKKSAEMSLVNILLLEKKWTINFAKKSRNNFYLTFFSSAIFAYKPY